MRRIFPCDLFDYFFSSLGAVIKRHAADWCRSRVLNSLLLARYQLLKCDCIGRSLAAAGSHHLTFYQTLITYCASLLPLLFPELYHDVWTQNLILGGFSKSSVAAKWQYIKQISRIAISFKKMLRTDTIDIWPIIEFSFLLLLHIFKFEIYFSSYKHEYLYEFIFLCDISDVSIYVHLMQYSS